MKPDYLIVARVCPSIGLWRFDAKSVGKTVQNFEAHEHPGGFKHNAYDAP
jgi:hypothetical protein